MHESLDATVLGALSPWLHLVGGDLCMGVIATNTRLAGAAEVEVDARRDSERAGFIPLAPPKVAPPG